MSAGGDVEIAVEQIRELDFSLGKVLYLSQMEPRETKYTPFFDVEFKYRRDSLNQKSDPRVRDQGTGQIESRHVFGKLEVRQIFIIELGVRQIDFEPDTSADGSNLLIEIRTLGVSVAENLV